MLCSCLSCHFDRQLWILINCVGSAFWKEWISRKVLVFSDPYSILRPTVVHELFDCTKSNELVSACLLKEIQHDIQGIFIPENSTYGSLQKQLNKISIFAGRNPLVSMLHCISNLARFIFFSGLLTGTCWIKSCWPTSYTMVGHLWWCFSQISSCSIRYIH